MTTIETKPDRLRPSDIVIGILAYLLLLAVVRVMGDPRDKDGAP